MDGAPFPTSNNPPELWDSISDAAKWQIFSVIAFLEFWSELSTPTNKHYMSGGRPGGENEGILRVRGRLFTLS